MVPRFWNVALVHDFIAGRLRRQRRSEANRARLRAQVPEPVAVRRPPRRDDFEHQMAEAMSGVLNTRPGSTRVMELKRLLVAEPILDGKLKLVYAISRKLATTEQIYYSTKLKQSAG